jgi:Putative Ig domain
MGTRIRVLALGMTLAGSLAVPATAAFAAGAPLSIDTAPFTGCASGICALGNITIGVPLSIPLSATGGSGTDVWSVSSAGVDLPLGVALDASDGASNTVLHGAPVTSGGYTFVVTVKDAAGDSVSQAFSFYVLQTSPPTAEPDGVTVTGATILTRDKRITVDADDPDTAAALTVTDPANGAVLGTLENLGNGQYSGTFSEIVGGHALTPADVEVASSLGAHATAAVVPLTPGY